MTRSHSSERHLFGLPILTAGMLAVVFAVAFGIYSLLWSAAPALEGDSAQYLEVAQDLADGRLDRLHFRTAGYPLLLVLTGSTTTPTRTLFYVSLLLHLASVWMLAVALRKAGANRSWVLGLGVLLVLPPYVEPAALVMTESLAQCFLVATVTSLVLWRSSGRVVWLLPGAIACALAGFVRPAYQLLSPALAIALVGCSFVSAETVRRECMRGAAVLTVAWLLILGSLAAFNWSRFGWFGVAPSAGFHLTTKTVAFLERLPDEYAAVREILIRERDAELTRRGGTHTGTQAVWAAQAELQRVTALTMPELSAYLVRMNMALIRRAPMEYLQEVARSAAVYWFPAAGSLAAMDQTLLRWTWALLHGVLLVLFAVQLAVAVSGAACAMTRRRESAERKAACLPVHVNDVQAFALTLAMGVVLYAMVVCCAIDIGEPRQRRSTDALFVFATVLGLFVWRRTAAAGESPQRPRGVLPGGSVGRSPSS